MSAQPSARRLLGTVTAPVVAIPLTAGLTGLGLVSLWVAPPPTAWQWVVIWELVMGAGFAAAGGAVTVVVRGSLPGRLFVLAAVLLLAAPLAAATGHPTAGDTAAVLAVALVAPLGLLRIVSRGPVAVLRSLEILAGLLGGVCVVATAVHAPAVALIAATALGVTLFCAGWMQFEVTTGDERRQVLWVVLGVCAAVPTGALFLTAVDGAQLDALTVALTLSVLSLALPLSAAVALIAPRSVDVRAVIRHTAVVAVMLTLTVAVYGGIEAGFRVADRPTSIGVRGLVVALIAAGFHPVMVRLRAIMDELLFGGRADPVDTMSRLGTQLTAGSAPQAWMDTLRVALAVPGVVLRRGGEVIAASGDVDGARTAVTPLRTGAEDVGELVVSLPTDQIRLTPATQAVLALVAAPLAQALHATRLGEQLKASRGRLVSALEDERRRIRRDLHDGLGPTLTGIAYSADAAANLVRVDGGQAIQVLRELRSDAGEAIAEVRRIVDGLRPRALDELGLVGAVQQRVSHVRAADGEVMAVDVTAPDDLPELPAAVEVAAYRVAVEAVTNVARHARVSAATVEFSVHEGPTLRVVICDRGRSGNPWRPGVGLASMRERVEQIGGELTVRNGDLGATITAHLPLTLPAAD